MLRTKDRTLIRIASEVVAAQTPFRFSQTFLGIGTKTTNHTVALTNGVPDLDMKAPCHFCLDALLDI